MPPTFAMELMSATPVAAAGPLRNIAGSALMMPAGPHNTVAPSMAAKAPTGLLSISQAIVPRENVASTNGTVE